MKTSEPRATTVRNLSRAVGGALILTGVGLAPSATTWLQVSLVVALPLIAGLVLLTLSSTKIAHHLMAWAGATTMLAATVLLAFRPELLIRSSFCDFLGSGPIRVCVLGQGGSEREWSDEVETSPGGVILVKAEAKAFGEVGHDTVLTLDLPKGIDLVEGGRISTGNTNGNWTRLEHALTPPGVNVGSYAPGGAVYVSFALSVNPTGYPCGTTKKPVGLAARSSAGSDSQSLVVRVENRC